MTEQFLIFDSKAELSADFTVHYPLVQGFIAISTRVAVEDVY